MQVLPILLVNVQASIRQVQNYVSASESGKNICDFKATFH